MNELKIFENKEFGKIRTVTINGEPYFVGKDVAEALGYERATKATVDHVDEEDRILIDGKTQSCFGIELGQRGGWLINESGLYSLILSSKLESAKRFKRWVTSDVLPSIRKNGGYISGQETMTDNELIAKALMVAQNKIADKDKQITEMKPKALFADAVSASHTSILVGDLAKLIRQNGVDIGARRLFEWLRSRGYLIKRKGTDWNMPTQKSMDLKLFEIKESTHVDGNGCNITTKTPKVTGKGQQYFINKFLEG